MTEKIHGTNGTTIMQNDVLRQEAEKRLAGREETAPDSTVRTADEIMHELRVHQIELEMQNEALTASQIALEESRDKFSDLYDFAPVGYVTLTKAGVIAEANLTAATILGIERGKLINNRIRKYIANEDLESWDWYFLGMLRHGEKNGCDLKFLRTDGGLISTRIESIRLDHDRIEPVVRTAIIDVTDRARVEEKLARSDHELNELAAAYDTINAGQAELKKPVGEQPDRVHLPPQH